MLLETLHKLPIIDDCTTFDAPSHTYTVNGIMVPRSVTAVITDEVTKQDECFEADKVIDKNLSTWRSKASSKYHELIRGKDDEEAKETIKALWDRANKLGTIMHHAFELTLNGESMPTAYSDGGADDVTKEMHDFQCFRSAFSKLKPHRTELCVYGCDAERRPIIAGQIDFVASKKDGSYVIIDFKRTDHNLRYDAFAFGRKMQGVLNGYASNDHIRYSFQTSIYSLLFSDLTGKPVTEKWLLQVHPNLDSYNLIKCTNFEAEAKQMLLSLGWVPFKN